MGIVETRPRKRRRDATPLVAAPGGSKGGKGLLTKPQAIFAALWAGGSMKTWEAYTSAHAALGLPLPPSRAVLRRKAERWLTLAPVRAEIERVAQLSGVSSAALAAMARRQLKDLLFDEDPFVRHHAVVTALRLNGDMRTNGKGGMESGRAEGGPAIGTLVVAQLNQGGTHNLSMADLERAVAAALGRSGEPNRIAHHRHAEGNLLGLPEAP